MKLVSHYMSVITQWGWSPLFMAAWDGVSKVVPLLLKAGANIDLQDNIVCIFDPLFLHSHLES